jgi:hypothetical protein
MYHVCIHYTGLLLGYNSVMLDQECDCIEVLDKCIVMLPPECCHSTSWLILM